MQVKRSAEERQRLLKEFEAGGQTRREFCERHGIAVATLDSWRKGRRRKPKLVEVTIAAQPGGAGFALTLCNGRRIDSSWSFAEADLARLIRAAEA